MQFSATSASSYSKARRWHLKELTLFVQRGLSYWKDATIAFKEHESSDCHKEAVEVSIVVPCVCPDVGEMLSSRHSKAKARKQGMAS